MQPSAFHVCLFASSECRHCRAEGWLALGTWKVAPGLGSVHGQLPVDRHRRRDAGTPSSHGTVLIPKIPAPRWSFLPLCYGTKSLWAGLSDWGHSLLIPPHRHQSSVHTLLEPASSSKLLSTRFPSLPTLIRPATITLSSESARIRPLFILLSISIGVFLVLRVGRPPTPWLVSHLSQLRLVCPQPDRSYQVIKSGLTFDGRRAAGRNRKNRMTRFRISSAIFVVWITRHLALGHYTAYNYGFDVHGRVKRELGQALRVVVRGDGGPDIRVRQEIRQLEQDQDVWNLYILALSMMQFTDQSEPTSWYGITGLRYHLAFCASILTAAYPGIHGMPHQTWGGVAPTPGNKDTGYCTHSSVLFPTWHRPYLALYEVC